MPESLPLIPAMMAVLTLVVVLRPMSHSRDRFGFRAEEQKIIPGTGVDPTTVEITGHIQNKSTMVNNLAQLHLVAWLPNRRDTILLESGPTCIRIEDDEVRLHIQRGKLINHGSIELRRQLTEWRIANIKDDKRRRVRALRMRIILSGAGFAIRRLFWFLGF